MKRAKKPPHKNTNRRSIIMNKRQAIIAGIFWTTLIFVLGMGPLGMQDEMKVRHRPGPGPSDPRPKAPRPLIISPLMDCLHRLQLSEENRETITTLLDGHRHEQRDRRDIIKTAVNTFLTVLTDPESSEETIAEAKQRVAGTLTEGLTKEVDLVHTIIDLLSEAQKENLSLCFDVCSD